MTDVIHYLLIVIAAGLFLVLFWACIVSYNEKEPTAGRRFLFLSFILPQPFLLFAFTDAPYHLTLSTILVILAGLFSLLLLLPFGNNKKYKHQIPLSQIDERDTMFSRNELIPGTETFEEYYNRKPQNKHADDEFRKKAGLLKPGSSQYNPIQFASADASFETIAALRDKVSGPVNQEVAKVDTVKISTYIKQWSKKLGAVDCGITELNPYHLYAVGGRKERRDKPVVNNHKFAIAFTVEMDKTMVDSAPTGSIVMESAQQYLESGKIALQVASFIRNLGYNARAHIDGNYQVVCPLVARDAGLGEIGRMGLLMTPKLGPRVRISVVTTDLPLEVNVAKPDYSVIDFCEKCKKCADACPSKAISFNEMQTIGGVERWQINQEDCFTLWCKVGTDCGRCVSVCPYSHPDNALHKLVRFGLKRNGLFRSLALKMDDYFYGRIPATKKIPDWLNINENT